MESFVSSRTDARSKSLVGSARSLSQSQQSSRKRRRYVLQACERCQRQKIRCNGQQPCDKCKGKQPRECSYVQRLHINGEQPQPRFNTAGGNIPPRDEDQDLTNGVGLPAAWNPAPFAHLESLLHSQSAKLDLLLERSKESHDSDGPPSCKPSESHIEHAEPTANLTNPAQARSSKAHLPLYCGPSSPYFCINIVGVTLNQTQDTPTREQEILEGGTVSILNGRVVIDHDERPEDDPPEPSLHPPLAPVTMNPHDESLYPLQALNPDQALRLVLAYDVLVGVMYPFLSQDDLLRNTTELYAIMSAPSPRMASNTRLDRTDVSIVKVVLAIVLVMDGLDNHELACRLFQSVQREVEAKIWATAIEVEDLHLLILVAIYHFVKGNWRLAWRVTHNLVRMALELGLNRQKVVVRTVQDAGKRVDVVNMFWTVFVLDRQMSYALGIPKNLQDADVDSGLPLPHNEPYLKAMVEYCHLGSKACDSLSEALSGEPRGTAEWRESFEYFCYLLDQWQRKNIDGDIHAIENMSSDQRIRHPRTVLYLRANQLRLLMLRPVLCGSNASLGVDDQHWKTAVGIACDTVQVVADLESTGDLYHRHQTLYNYFLVTALGVLLLLGLAQEPRSTSPPDVLNKAHVGQATHDQAREAATTALSLLKSTMSHSAASKRLWLRAHSMCLRLGVIPGDHVPQPGSTVSVSGWPNAPEGVADFSTTPFPELGDGLQDLHMSWAGLTPDVGWLLPEFPAM